MHSTPTLFQESTTTILREIYSIVPFKKMSVNQVSLLRRLQIRTLHCVEISVRIQDIGLVTHDKIVVQCPRIHILVPYQDMNKHIRVRYQEVIWWFTRGHIMVPYRHNFSNGSLKSCRIPPGYDPGTLPKHPGTNQGCGGNSSTAYHGTLHQDIILSAYVHIMVPYQSLPIPTRWSRTFLRHENISISWYSTMQSLNGSSHAYCGALQLRISCIRKYIPCLCFLGNGY